MQKYDFSKIPGFTPPRQYADNKLFIVRRALNILLNNRRHISSDVLINLEINGIVLGTGGFTVVIFEPLDSNNDEFPLLEVLENLEALVAKTFESNCANQVCQTNTSVTVLCYFPQLLPQDTRDDEIKDFMSRMARTVIDLCQNHLNLTIMAAISGLDFGVDSISGLFASAADILDYSRYMLRFDDISISPDILDTATLFLKSADIEKAAHQIANNILTGSSKPVSEKLNLLIDSVIHTKSASTRDLHFSLLLFVYFFTSALLKLEIVDAHYFQKLNILRSLYAAPDVESLIDALNEIIDNARLYSEKKEANRNAAILEQSQRYITDHFTDPNLSVAGLADALGINQTTLSNLYKKHYGQTIGADIRQYRVEMAKELIRSGEQLAQAAIRAGFGSMNTMYRAFKRDEGITPGEFRRGERE